MRLLLWSLCVLSVVGIFYADEIHVVLSNIKYYQFSDKSIIQVILAVAAGIFATKASDSSREIKALLKIDKIGNSKNNLSSKHKKELKKYL